MNVAVRDHGSDSPSEKDVTVKCLDATNRIVESGDPFPDPIDSFPFRSDERATQYPTDSISDCRDHSVPSKPN